MFIAYVVVAGLLALASAGSAFMTFTKNPQVVGSMAKVGVAEGALPWLATAKAAGALGLLAGLFVPLLGQAAAVGLVLYFAGAVISHLRVKDFELAPAAVLALIAATALVLRIASA
ncbi:DoxX family protein [Streptomyces sp. TLI_105]|uniref:DoxX family protein n=1 Tax=Streptomyces sp. TLI_105 TaxID=1881019 RepID=UPI00089B7799|nr:DoxX family protein [Streptomyces sp. TLI_105]SED02555.1 DoxX-like family protein [Streptomyces sp. TLI_105]